MLVIETLPVICAKFHAHSAKYAHKLVTTKRSIENEDIPHCQVLEPGAFSNPSRSPPALSLLGGQGDLRIF
eukprot:1162007-Pelagomonas_calceolata.AAC.4